MKALYYVNPSSLDTDMKKLGLAIREMVGDLGKSVQVEFEKAKQKKTKEQIAYYNILARLACKENGDDVEDFKFRMKHKLGYYDEVDVEGVTEKRVKSLSDASLDELIVFIDAVMTVCDYLNVKFMLPDEYYRKIGAKQ